MVKKLEWNIVLCCFLCRTLYVAAKVLPYDFFFDLHIEQLNDGSITFLTLLNSTNFHSWTYQSGIQALQAQCKTLSMQRVLIVDFHTKYCTSKEYH